MTALRSYWLLVQWQARRMKAFLPLAIVVQTLFALGILLGYPLLFPALDTGTILYLATGAPGDHAHHDGPRGGAPGGRAGTHRGDPRLHAQPAAAAPDLPRGRRLDLAGHRPARGRARHRDRRLALPAWTWW